MIDPPDAYELEPEEIIRRRPKRRRRGGVSLRVTTGGVILLLVANFVVIGLIAWPLLQARLSWVAQASTSVTPLPPSLTPTSSLTPTETTPPSTSTPTTSPTPSPIPPYPGGAAEQIEGLIVLAMRDGQNTHLFGYSPPNLGLTRLTSGPWDDINPSLSMDGSKVAFASNRNGYWDLYILELSSGSLSRLTDSLSYEGRPSWSPDGLWLAYEAYTDAGGLEIFIGPADGSGSAVQLTMDPAADHSPAWSPLGRAIAFVSTLTGDPEIWLADLDQIGEGRFRNISFSPGTSESHPVWSANGSSLAWSSEQQGYHNLEIWDLESGKKRYAGSGDWPAWSPDGRVLLAALFEPDSTYLAAYDLGAAALAIPPIQLPGSLEGITWGPAADVLHLREAYRAASALTPEPLWQPVLTPIPEGIPGRFMVVPLIEVEAPNAYLHDLVDESFYAMRNHLAQEIGWDLLADLVNAYVPLTSSLDPGRGMDWLYTGRAFEFTPLPVNAGWMALVREDHGPQTFWRVYLRVRYQDGSAGLPLHDLPWDFSARYNGDMVAHEEGGRLANAVPGGFWLDFTQFALDYGWIRVPAQTSWRSSYPAARFNEYVLADGLDWTSAMLELYPSEILITPTLSVPPTRTPTPTPRWYQTPTPTITPSPRPTLTALPATATLLPTETLPPLPTSTLSPTKTAANP